MKKIVAFLLLAIFAISTMAFPASAAYNPNDEFVPLARRTLPNISVITVSDGNTSIRVNFNSDYVGWRYSPTRNVVKVCQAYTKASGSDPGGIDGYWGPNSEAALRGAQTTLYNYGYNSGNNEIVSDGECGPRTWRGFYGYNNGVPGTVVDWVFNS